MMRILVTGANGFVGKSLCRLLQTKGYFIRGVVRRAAKYPQLTNISELCLVGEIGPETDWQDALENIDVVIHLAARVHVMKDRSLNPLSEFRKVNVAGTEQLARQAVSAGVRRMVFISSVKVNGEGKKEPYTEDDEVAPEDAYGISKLEAEVALSKVASETGLEVVNIRPPLVYGSGVKANFLRLMHGVQSGIPLPLGCISNRRSFIYLGNLVDAIAACVKHPKAAGQTYLVSDGDDVSTPELIRRVAAALGRRARLFPFPPALMHMAGNLLGKSAAIESLLGSLTIDSGKIRRELEWKPPYSMEEGLKETAEWYLSVNRNYGNLKR